MPREIDSPFTPGIPVPAELFEGRREQIERLINRHAQEVIRGKSQYIFIQGEYGIGKTSLVLLVQSIARNNLNLHPIYVRLGGVKDVQTAVEELVRATIRSFDRNTLETVTKFLGKYIASIELFGIAFNFANIKQDAPHYATPLGLFQFLETTWSQLKSGKSGKGIKGLFLVFDELNGIASNPDFAPLLKSFIETNSTEKEREIPLLLLLCGTEERRRVMIEAHQPFSRVVEVIDIPLMNQDEVISFFKKAFSSVHMNWEEKALKLMAQYSSGYPNLMHLIGDAAYRLCNNDLIDLPVAVEAIFKASEEIGDRYLEPQVYKALKSKDYLSILQKIGEMTKGRKEFQKGEIEKELSPAQRKKFNNFLQKMKRLKVLTSGTEKGEYIFTSRLVALYIYLRSRERVIR